MGEKVFIDWVACQSRANMIACDMEIAAQTFFIGAEYLSIYGVPRGGIAVSFLVAEALNVRGNLVARVVFSSEDADFIVDDIIDTGKTKKLHDRLIGEGRFFALVDKQKNPDPFWYVFPWEGSEVASAEDIPLRFLQFIGENVERDGLKDTPARIIRSWGELYAGYKMDPDSILSTAFDNEEGYDEMVILRDIEFYSTCEHHALPFYGKVHIAYVPQEKGKVVGISKLARLVECFARRLQIQERLTKQISDSIQRNLNPQGVAVFIEAQHFCMTSRGVKKQGSTMVTSSLLGCMRLDAARMEFLLLAKR